MMFRRLARAACAVVFAFGLVAGATFASGDALAQSPTITKLSTKEAEGLFRELGYTGIETDRDGDLVVNIQGMKVLVLVGSAGGESMQMRFGMTGTDATLERVNTWNKTKMYSRAYLDEDGDPVLEAEQDLVGGVTLDRLKDFIKTYGVSLSTFLREVI